MYLDSIVEGIFIKNLLDEATSMGAQTLPPNLNSNI
jgi:hypothetical protein